MSFSPASAPQPGQSASPEAAGSGHAAAHSQREGAPQNERSERLAALRRLIELEYPSVWRFLRRLGVSESNVDDAAQLVFARVLAREDVIRAGCERAYLMRAAYHISFEYRRARQRAARRDAPIEVDELEAALPDPDEALVRRRDAELLDRALACLSDELRAAFTLFELEGMTFSEIAEVLAVPRGTVASRVRRARQQFIEAVQRLRPGRQP